MRNNTISDLKKMIDVNIPIIYICDFDFVRVDAIITEAIGSKKIYEWNPATGTTDFRNKESIGMGKEQTLQSFLSDEYKAIASPEKFLVLKEVQDYLDEPEVKTLLALMSQRKLYDRSYDTTVFLVSSVRKVPEEIAPYVSYLEMDVLGEEDEINALIEAHLKVNDFQNFGKEDREKLMPSLKGMTPFEIDRVLDMAMSNNGTLSAEDNELILRQKKQMVKKSGLLELIDTPQTLDSIGGMEVLKKYLERKAEIVRRINEANRFGVPTPKGVFIVGMPGCGKSLCAKASASLFNAPLLKLDMGSMMGKYVGQSEENLRKAIKIAEAAAPCILWIDEIEKAFSGVGGSNNDIMTRMFGYFLTWLQDKKGCVYVIATANNANNLPPELKRKGRFDEIFCVNLPDDKEREAIFRVHLKNKNCAQDILKGDLSEAVKATEGFNGADIESVVNEAVEECFLHLEKGDKLKLSDLVGQAEKTVSISKSCKKQIEEMKKIFKDSNFTDSSKKK